MERASHTTKLSSPALGLYRSSIRSAYARLIGEPDFRSVEAVSLGFHVGMPSPISSVIGSENALIEHRGYHATRLLPFGFASPRLEFSRQYNGESGARAGHRRRLDDANRGIDDPAT